MRGRAGFSGTEVAKSANAHLSERQHWLFFAVPHRKAHTHVVSRANGFFLVSMVKFILLTKWASAFFLD